MSKRPQVKKAAVRLGSKFRLDSKVRLDGNFRLGSKVIIGKCGLFSTAAFLTCGLFYLRPFMCGLLCIRPFINAAKSHLNPVYDHELNKILLCIRFKSFKNKLDMDN